MKVNKIGYEMLDSTLKSILDKNVDTGLVKSFLDIPNIRTEDDHEAYIILDDDIYMEENEEKNRKGYIYYAENIGEGYIYVGKQNEIEFTPYDLLENNPFAFKEHTHDLSGSDYTIFWDSVTGKPESWHPSRHTHVSGEVSVDWEDINEKPEVFPPAEHSHGSGGELDRGWEDILNKPGLYGNNLLHNTSFKVHQRYKDLDFPLEIVSDGEAKMIFDRWAFINELNIPMSVSKVENGGFSVEGVNNVSNYDIFKIRQTVKASEIGYSKGAGIKRLNVSVNGEFDNVYSIELYINNMMLGNLNNSDNTNFQVNFGVLRNDIVFELQIIFKNDVLPSFKLYNIKMEAGEVKTDYVDISESLELMRCKRYYQRLTLPENVILSASHNHIRLIYPGYIGMIETPSVKSLNDLYIHKTDGSSHIKIAGAGDDLSTFTNLEFKDSALTVNTKDKLYTIPEKTYYVPNSSSAELLWDENEIELSVGY
ncbi:hypothetical protein [Anaerofustis stercorihominis]|uniref:hypothetical protein n=1 Tax=Anaerofustis stercorihominis TaxID=214853 RepID=UPI00214BFCEE|nr:hypothetical protein [Anaerofustis stercorihominis]MCR2033695.1 hypothetical protein [Anaerofustis stercorihominis]